MFQLLAVGYFELEVTVEHEDVLASWRIVKTRKRVSVAPQNITPIAGIFPPSSVAPSGIMQSLIVSMWERPSGPVKMREIITLFLWIASGGDRLELRHYRR